MALTKKILINRRNGETLGCDIKSLSPNRSGDLSSYALLHDTKWIEHYVSGDIDTSHYHSTQSRNIVDFVTSRSIGNGNLQRASLTNVYGTRHLLQNELFEEQCFDLGRLNKVFASQWINDNQVMFGTKCNRLMVLDINNAKKYLIPTLLSSPLRTPSENPCGIHTIAINPSRTLLATGGDNPNDIAIYKLPTLDPICVGEKSHSDWIFDSVWLDDEFLVTGSRDTTLALWRIQDNPELKLSSSYPNYYHITSLLTKECKNAEKIRALLFNPKLVEIVALSLNAYLHVFDAETFKQKYSSKLECCHENVCLAQEFDRGIYAVGSKSHVTLLDSRTLETTRKVVSKYSGCGIRSLSFCNDLLTIGTGFGVMLFYDVRSHNYLENIFEKHVTLLKTNKGCIYPDQNFEEIFPNVEYNPAIYTHQYDMSRTRLFTAGGPLPASLHGNYAGLWR